MNSEDPSRHDGHRACGTSMAPFCQRAPRVHANSMPRVLLLPHVLMFSGLIPRAFAAELDLHLLDGPSIGAGGVVALYPLGRTLPPGLDNGANGR